MSTWHLDTLLAPRSVAIIGAGLPADSVGRAVLRNLREGGFGGAVHLVSPDHGEIDGVAAVPRLEALAAPPDVAVVAAPASQMVELVAAAGARGVKAAIALGTGSGRGEDGVAAAAASAARAHGMRLLGPDSIGLIVPAAKLNASLALRMPPSDGLALISQSGAVAAGVVEWAAQHRVGFSAAVSMGAAVDVDFGDLLDHFALDRATAAILMYVEEIRDAKKFMSAARAAARTKPVIVVKPGRHAGNGPPASDAVYDAAFRRAGLLRVRDLDELFAAAETLGHLHPFRGKRLAIVSNGAAPGALAFDRLIDLGGVPAELDGGTVARLDAVLPLGWSRRNPIDILADADADRYREVLAILLAWAGADAVLVMHAPTALVPAAGAAGAVVAATASHRAHAVSQKPVLAVWIGADAGASGAFGSAGIPVFSDETDAVQGFMHLVRWREAIDGLMATPPSMPEEFSYDPEAARAVIAAALSAGRGVLDPAETQTLLAAYGIPAAPAGAAGDATLDLAVTVADDPVFGPVVAFGGSGGAEAAADRAVALPPLDLMLARDLIGRTRLASGLARWPEAREAAALVLVKAAQLVADCPAVRTLAIEPLRASQDGAGVVQARVTVAQVERPAGANERFAVRPYPKAWERRVTAADGSPVLLRPVRPEDEELMRAFFGRVSPEDLRLRFFAPVRDFGHAFVARLTQLDYARAMAFVALDERSGDMLGGVRLHADANYRSAEYAVLVRSDLKGRGIGWLLMHMILDYARAEGLARIEGQVLRENTAMLAMCTELGFRTAPSRDDPGVIEVSLDLDGGRDD